MLTTKETIITVILLIVYILSSILEYLDEYPHSEFLVHSIVPIITISYIAFIKNKEKLFFLFLLFFSLGDILFCLSMLYFNFDYYEFATSTFNTYLYYIANGMIIISHLFLFIKIYNISLLRYILKHLKIHLVVLILLNIYLVYIVEKSLIIEEGGVFGYCFDLVYNIVFLVLLTMAFLNYLYKDNRKSIFMFIGVLFIFFNEILDISFEFIYKSNTTVFIANTCLLIAFCLFYLQSKMPDTPKPEMKI